MKKISKDKQLLEHGYIAYACGRNQYSLHQLCQPSPQSYRGTFKTKREAIAQAFNLPKIDNDHTRFLAAAIQEL
jgi:hypothetical protein